MLAVPVVSSEHLRSSVSSSALQLMSASGGRAIECWTLLFVDCKVEVDAADSLRIFIYRSLHRE